MFAQLDYSCSTVALSFPGSAFCFLPGSSLVFFAFKASLAIRNPAFELSSAFY